MMKNEMIPLNRFYDKLLCRHAERVAINFHGEELTYNTIDERSGRLANVFRSMGVKAGDCVAIMMENRPEYVITEIAAMRAGATAIPMNSKLSESSIRHILEDANARTLVIGPAFFSTGRNLQQDDSFDINYIIGIGTGKEFPIGFHSFDELLSKADTEPPNVNTSPEDVAAIYYTSGTTGEQKGVMHTHRGLILNIYSHIAELEIGQQEQVLLPTPLGHSAGFFARATLAQGGTIVLQQEYEPTRFLEMVESEEITWSFLVPTMVSELIDVPILDRTNTDSLETLVYGASPIPSAVLKEGVEKLGQIFIQLYGLTEVPNLVSVLAKSEHDPDHENLLTSAGYPVQLAEVSIVDPDDRWNGEVGEIAVTSPYAMKGYHNRDTLVSEQEPIYTGDLGRIDDEGRLYVLDRIQDVIISDGKLVFSSEIENVVQRHPDVHQVAIIGVPKDRDTFDVTTSDRLEVEQIIKAVVVATDVSLETIQEFCYEEGLNEYQIPQSIDTVGKLPETPYGKVDKKALRNPYW